MKSSENVKMELQIELKDIGIICYTRMSKPNLINQEEADFFSLLPIKTINHQDM